MVWKMGVVFQHFFCEKWVYNFQTCHVPIGIASMDKFGDISPNN